MLTDAETACPDSTERIYGTSEKGSNIRKPQEVTQHYVYTLRFFVVLKDTVAMKAGKVTDGGRATDSSLSWSPLQLREESANSWSGLQLFSERWLQRFSITSATFLHQPHFIRYMEDNS